MPLTILPESHIDHVSREVLDFIIENYKDCNGRFVETLTLPDHLGEVDNGLYGPACGDPPVPELEVTYSVRKGRTLPSRMVNRPKRKTRQITVIAGPYQEHPCVLYTVFGGPLAEREWDVNMSPGEQEKSRRFWDDHALAAEES